MGSPFDPTGGAASGGDGGGVNFGQLLGMAGEQLDILPKGNYDVIVDKAEAVKSKRTNKDGIKVTYKVEAGPQAGRKIVNGFYISPESPNALGIFFRQMAAMGLDSQWFTAGPSMDQTVQRLHGARANLDVEHGTYNNQPTLNVGRVNPPRGGASAGPQPGAPAPQAPAAPAPQAPPAPAAPAAPAPQAQAPAPAPPAPVAPAPVAPAPAPEPAPQPEQAAPPQPQQEQAPAPAPAPVAEAPAAPAPPPAPPQPEAPAAPPAAPPAPPTPPQPAESSAGGPPSVPF